MEMKHTPGPWRARRNNAFWEINPINAGDDGIPFSVGDVCSSAPNNPDGGLQEANARLIAAAPEMLEALKEILDCANGLIDEREILNIATTAIAKATGGAQ